MDFSNCVQIDSCNFYVAMQTLTQLRNVYIPPRSLNPIIGNPNIKGVKTTIKSFLKWSNQHEGYIINIYPKYSGFDFIINIKTDLKECFFLNNKTISLNNILPISLISMKKNTFLIIKTNRTNKYIEIFFELVLLCTEEKLNLLSI